LRLQAEINDKNFEIVSADGLNRAAFFKTHNSGSRVSFVPDGGRVGIGITNPWSIFHVVTSETGNVSKLHNPTLADGSLVGYEFGKNNSANNMAEFRYNHVSDGNTANWINLGLWGNANTLNITGAGNVGVGTTAPEERLHVLNNADDAIVKIESPGSSYEARMEVHKFDSYSAGVGYYPGNANLRLRTNTNTAIVFEPNGTEAMRVNQNGNVGIGTTSPADELHVEGSIRMVDGNQAAGYIPVSDANGTMTWTDPSAISGVNELSDADNDTKIQVEESADEDIIRFDIAGTEVATLEGNGRLQFLNNNTSVFQTDDSKEQANTCTYA
jgi:hypothetical protein